MFNFFRFYRERGWQTITAADYAAAAARFGCSVATHPEIVRRLSELAGVDVRYLGSFAGGELQAALPAWGRHLALARRVLKRRGQRELFDLGNAEIILPQAGNSRIALRHCARWLSEAHAGRISTLRKQREALALARPPEDYARKFAYNQRRELRLFTERGGRAVALSGLPASEIAAIYRRLFALRWGFAAPGEAHLDAVFSRLHEFLTGSCLFIGEQAVAIQILYRVESPAWVSVEYINGGVDPAWRELSPGSVLSFINLRDEWQFARARQKTLRYSFGRADSAYKDRWCHRAAAYSTGGW